MNYFDILDIDLLYPEIMEWKYSLWASIVAILIILLAIHFFVRLGKIK